MAAERENLIVSWKGVAIGATTVALAALATVAVVATIKGADTLSVVALSLAIIAFIVQILVFIVQAAASSQQELRAQELYASTIKILSTIEEKAEGTRRQVTTINDRMLEAILSKAIPETAISTRSTALNFSEAVTDRAVQLANQADMQAPDRSVLRRRDSHENSEMYTYPGNSEAERLITRLQDLPSNDLYALRVLGEDEDQYVGGGVSLSLTPGLAVQLPRLVANGLVTSVERSWSKVPVSILTSDGKVAARLLLTEEIPEDAPDGLFEIRKKMSTSRPQVPPDDAVPAAQREEDQVPKS